MEDIDIENHLEKTFENLVFGLIIDRENLDIYSLGRGHLFKCLDNRYV